MSYSRICNHRRTTRINENFIRCLECGQSLIYQVRTPSNKSRQEFTKENPSAGRNFDRNFNNFIEEADSVRGPIYEYYVDRNCVNMIMIDRQVLYRSNPPKYRIIMNGEEAILTDDQIKKILNDVRAVRIDEDQFQLRCKWYQNVKN